MIEIAYDCFPRFVHFPRQWDKAIINKIGLPLMFHTHTH